MLVVQIARVTYPEKYCIAKRYLTEESPQTRITRQPPLRQRRKENSKDDAANLEPTKLQDLKIARCDCLQLMCSWCEALRPVFSSAVQI
jgi:hypothetical protein